MPINIFVFICCGIFLIGQTLIKFLNIVDCRVSNMDPHEIIIELSMYTKFKYVFLNLNVCMLYRSITNFFCARKLNCLAIEIIESNSVIAVRQKYFLTQHLIRHLYVFFYNIRFCVYGFVSYSNHILSLFR